jgi:peptidoglycan/xylan/chitin deacetylase (PgdA/CDA1 family)
VSILAYHMVDSRFNWGMTRVTPQTFARQLKFLVDHHFTIMTISDYLAVKAPRQRTVAITFDDGYESVYCNAFPILRQYGVAATVFVNPAFVGQFNGWDVTLGRRFRHMDWRQLGELKEHGWEIGSHGMRHRDLTQLSDDQLEWELRLAADLIARRTGGCSTVLSYPFGNASRRVADKAEELKYEYGLNMGMSARDVRLHYSIRRTGVYLLECMPAFRLKAGAKCNFFFNLLQKILDLCSDVTVALRSKSWTLD